GVGRSGELTRAANRKFVAGPALPEIMPIERCGSDAEGVPLARPVAWSASEEVPSFRLIGAAGDELAPGERALARLIRRDSGEIDAEIIRRLDEAASRVVGVFRRTRDGGVIVAADRRDKSEYHVLGHDAAGLTDDEVWAEPDTDPANRDGWHIVVAIADVSFYVAPGSALDREALRRGNSIYFPDRVVPMLPEALSNDLCSLVPGADRRCLAAHLW